MTNRQRSILAGLFLGVTLCAWLLAFGITKIAKGYLELPEDAAIASRSNPDAADGGDGEPTDASAPEKPTPSRTSSSRRPAPSQSGFVDPIVSRNIFDSSLVGQVTTPGPTGSDQKSDLKVVLLATVVAVPEEFSSALITEAVGTAAEGYGIGDMLLNEAEIIKIEPRRVLIKRSDDSIEYIAFEEEPTTARSSSRSSSSSSEQSEDGVTSAGDNRYVVDQEVIDGIIENPEQLYSQVRVVPHKDSNGEIDGYRLSGIRRRSFFYKLGVKNGDIVHSVNGQSLTSMSSAMDAYNSLSSEQNFSFEITRRNQRQTFEYEIR